MVNSFFEGKDFRKTEFKALMPKYYPDKYKNYISEEENLLKNKLKGSNHILEAGVGIGRLIPKLAPLVEEFIGVDNSNLMMKEAKKASIKFSNVKLLKINLEELSKYFPDKYFDYSLCVWNTIGNIKNEAKVLKEISKVTSKSIFITVYHKGTIEDRKNWYKQVGIGIKKIDDINEIFYSHSGLKSKSYNLEDVEKIAKKSGLKIIDYRILGKVILWVELYKDRIK